MSYFGENNAFGIVTVMDVKVYDYDETRETTATTPAAYLTALDQATAKATIDHMQVATLSTDGPNITIQGGKFNNTLIKYGKTARCEMTDALGQADALVALGGAVLDAAGNLSITDKFSAPVTLVGDSFVVDKNTGKHVPVKVLMYKFLPDSTPSFAFDSGNATTFDLNGDLLAVELGASADITSSDACPDGEGYFFSIIPTNCKLGK